MNIMAKNVAAANSAERSSLENIAIIESPPGCARASRSTHMDSHLSMNPASRG